MGDGREGSFSSEHLFMCYSRRGIKVLWKDPPGHFFPSVPGHRSEMHTLLSCCATTKQPMFSRQRRHCVTNSEITPNIPTCVLQTFFCPVHRPFCPARSKRRQFEKYFSSIDGIQRLGRARFLIPTTADKFEAARCAVLVARRWPAHSGPGGKNKMPGVKNQTILWGRNVKFFNLFISWTSKNVIPFWFILLDIIWIQIYLEILHNLLILWWHCGILWCKWWLKTA